MKIYELVNLLETIAPIERQMEWDNSGLQIGSLKNEITQVLVSLDCDEHTVEYAINNNCNLVINHHPILFQPIRSLNESDFRSKVIMDLVKNDITVYAMHTNLDVAPLGVNHHLAELCGITPMGFIEDQGNGYGLGIYGTIEEQSAKEYLMKVKETLVLPSVIYYGNLDDKIRRVGVVGGAGSSAIFDAADLSLDLLITGDVKYHEGDEALDRGLFIADIGHYESENHIIYFLKKYIQDMVQVPVHTLDRQRLCRSFI